MVHYVDSGNLFNSKADALVNSVNSQGFMGKGIALEFSKRFPEILEPYRKACGSGALHPGVLMYVRLDVRMAMYQGYAPHQTPLQEREVLIVAESKTVSPFVFDRQSEAQRDLPGEKRPVIILFPTKDHWRLKSRIEWIDQGLACLRDSYQKWGLKSIAMPQLGCGLGGLQWERVKPVIERYFVEEPVDVEVYLMATNMYDETRIPAANDNSRLVRGSTEAGDIR